MMRRKWVIIVPVVIAVLVLILALLYWMGAPRDPELIEVPVPLESLPRP